MACAWATFFCYGTMMVLSYIWGQKTYRIPYAWKKLVAYMVICVLLYGVYALFRRFDFGDWPNRGFGMVLFCLFAIFIINVEKKEFQKMPYIGRLLTPRVVRGF